MHREPISIAVSGQELSGTFAVPETHMPGVLFIHGWSGSQQNDLHRAEEIAGLGCVCLTFDLRGHAGTEAMRGDVTPADNMADILAAYDRLVGHPLVDKSAIAVIGSSYGGYLAALLTAKRTVRWLSLRVPALYRDNSWESIKARLDRDDLNLYRGQYVSPDANTALGACAGFEGDVLVVESEFDHLVPHTTISNYVGAFRKAKSLTYRVVKGADHALTEKHDREAYSSLLIRWIKEMVIGAR